MQLVNSSPEQPCEVPVNRLKEHARHVEEAGEKISHCDLLGTGQGSTGEAQRDNSTLLLRTIAGLGEEGGRG